MKTTPGALVWFLMAVAPSTFTGPLGAAPALLEAVTGELRIRSSGSPQLKEWRLNVVGQRVQEIPVSASAGEFSLALRPEREVVSMRSPLARRGCNPR